MGRTLIACALALPLAGCLLGPDYRRPPVDVPPSWRVDEGEAKQVANTAWWEQFGDPVLNELIRSALQENKDVKIAAARIENFVGQYTTTRAALFPQVAAGASAGRQRVSTVTGPSPQLEGTAGLNPTFNDLSASFTVGWEIDLWGKLRRATEASRANVLGTEEARRSVILTLVTSVATGYISLAELDKRLEVTRRTVKSYQDAYDIFKLRFEYGVVSDLDVSQARSQLELAASNVPLFQKLIALQENALSVLLGRNPGAIPRGKAIDQLLPPAVPAGLPSEILESRPDVRQAEASLVAANANIGVARALYFPSISLTSLFGAASSDLSKLFTGPAMMWSVGGSLTAPIFTAGAIAGQVKSAEASKEENLIRYQQIVQGAFREVNDALVDQQRTREQRDSILRQVDALRNYVDTARLRYDGGYSSYLEVVYAESLLYTAELQHAETQGIAFQAMVNVYKAMGGGWVTQVDQAATSPR